VHGAAITFAGPSGTEINLGHHLFDVSALGDTMTVTPVVAENIIILS
jgi:hypothetical protein